MNIIEPDSSSLNKCCCYSPVWSKIYHTLCCGVDQWINWQMCDWGYCAFTFGIYFNHCLMCDISANILHDICMIDIWRVISRHWTEVCVCVSVTTRPSQCYMKNDGLVTCLIRWNEKSLLSEKHLCHSCRHVPPRALPHELILASRWKVGHHWHIIITL